MIFDKLVWHLELRLGQFIFIPKHSQLRRNLTNLISALDRATAFSRPADRQTAYSPVSVSGVTVPQYGVWGEHAVLYCSYSSVQPVYSVRWYKNGKEFFR